VQDGSILPIEVETPRPCSEAEGEWLGRDVRLSSAAGRWRALLPVPLGAASELKLVARCGPRAARFRIAVRQGSYPESKLMVDPKFSRPPPPRAALEQRAITAAYERGGPASLWHEPFLRPTPGVETSPYGVRRMFNDRIASRHFGLDYSGEVGDPIVSANEGVVVLAGADYFFTGNCVFIDHGNGLFTTYFHMSRLEVQTGDHVTRGQEIGRIGATGRVTGPHLHFGVKLLGYYVNPVDLLGLPAQLSAAAPSAQK
jgi:murein DD-endopeptidase MepM/ murein hydrolase activator NlpD